MSLDLQELDKRFEEIDANIEILLDTIKPVIENNQKKSLQGLDIPENVRLQLTLAYSMNALLYAYLRLQGGAPRDHRIHQDMARIKTYMQRFSKLKDNASELNECRKNSEETVRFSSLSPSQ